jgi:protocatechuate 3,4-dioxygenase beta subunit
MWQTRPLREGAMNGKYDPKKMTRRAALEAFGGAAAVMVVGCGTGNNGEEEEGAAKLQEGDASCTAPTGDAGLADPPVPACVVTPAQTEGPFFVDERLERSDLIAADPLEAGVQRGIPLLLKMGVFAVPPTGCRALPRAYVDIWHSDANGIYSDEYKPTIQPQDTRGRKFLRAYQITDADGQVAFKTIYPGAYPARTIHIHFKIRLFAPDGHSTYEFTSQLYFDDRISDGVPYNRNRAVRNVNDGIYRQGGQNLLLNVRGNCAVGYEATFAIGLRSA